MRTGKASITGLFFHIFFVFAGTPSHEKERRYRYRCLLFANVSSANLCTSGLCHTQFSSQLPERKEMQALDYVCVGGLLR
jgi:hypothetical protein